MNMTFVEKALAELPSGRTGNPYAARLIQTLLRGRYVPGDHGIAMQPYGSTQIFTVEERIPCGFASALAGGGMRLMASYARSEWNSPDLYQALSSLYQAERTLRYITLPLFPYHYLNGHRLLLKKPKDYESVALHYEIPHTFFERFLGPIMAYSAASTRHSPDDFTVAYRQSYDTILENLDLPAGGGRILDLGAGWGTLAEYVLENTSHHLDAITISPTQASYIQRRVADKADRRIGVKLRNFMCVSSLPAVADAILMIESLEHVHPRDRPQFLGALRRRYPTARVLIQFTGHDSWTHHQRAGRATSMISVIFPGPSVIPSVRHVMSAARRAGYEIIISSDLTSEYAAVTLTWLHRFQTAMPELSGTYNTFFLRAWEFYLAGLAAGLSQRSLISTQLVLAPR